MISFHHHFFLFFLLCIIISEGNEQEHKHIIEQLIPWFDESFFDYFLSEEKQPSSLVETEVLFVGLYDEFEQRSSKKEQTYVYQSLQRLLVKKLQNQFEFFLTQEHKQKNDYLFFKVRRSINNFFTEVKEPLDNETLSQWLKESQFLIQSEQQWKEREKKKENLEIYMYSLFSKEYELMKMNISEGMNTLNSFFTLLPLSNNTILFPSFEVYQSIYLQQIKSIRDITFFLYNFNKNELQNNIKPSFSKEEANKIISSLDDHCVIDSLQVRQRRVESKPPFTTSTMQQEAYLKHRYSTKKTQSIAQKLYEGIDLGNQTIGLITYMRTDSIRLSPEFVNNALGYIKKEYGDKYVGKENNRQGKGLIQDAHEAIRPTSLELTPKSIKQYLSTDEYNLYSLIYKRALASLMAAKLEEVTQVKLQSGKSLFKCEGIVTTFDGYSKLYESSEKTEDSKKLPLLSQGQVIAITKVNKEQKFTLPPARFNEAKLVKTMEELGIGRPSTYASTISTLKTRKYVTSEKGVFTPTDQGTDTVINLCEFFPPFMDTTYTSNMEKKLDDIVDGNDSRLNLLNSFYQEFNSLFLVAQKEMSKAKPVETGELCPLCGSPLVIKKSKYGEFTACSNYPDCHYIKPKEVKPLEILENEVCPKCGKPLVKRTSKNGEFYACSGFPKCRYIKGQEENKKQEDVVSDKVCPKCGKPLLIKKGRNNKGDFYACSGFPRCRYIESIK